MRRILQIVLEGLEIESVAASSAEEALELFDKQPFDLVLTDLKLPGMDAPTCCRSCASTTPTCRSSCWTAYGTVQTAVDAMKLGAFDFIPSRSRSRTSSCSWRALDLRRVHTENMVLREQAAQVPKFENLVGLVDRDARGLRDDPAGRADALERADHRRDRHGEGAGGARDPR